MTKVRYMGTHADEVAVGDKRVPVAPGDFVDMSDTDMKHENNERLFADNLLVDISTMKSTTAMPGKEVTTNA